jgi:hypothetical protein
MRKFLLNVSPGEPLSLVQEFPYFDNMIKLKLLLESDIELCVHDLIHGFMFYAVRVELYRCQLFLLPLRCPIMVESMAEGGPH